MALKNKIITKNNKVVTVGNKIATGCGEIDCVCDPSITADFNIPFTSGFFVEGGPAIRDLGADGISLCEGLSEEGDFNFYMWTHDGFIEVAFFDSDTGSMPFKVLFYAKVVFESCCTPVSFTNSFSESDYGTFSTLPVALMNHFGFTETSWEVAGYGGTATWTPNCPCEVDLSGDLPPGPYPSILTIKDFNDGLFDPVNNPDVGDDCTEDCGDGEAMLSDTLTEYFSEVYPQWATTPTGGGCIPCVDGRFQRGAAPTVSWDDGFGDVGVGVWVLGWSGLGDYWQGKKAPGDGPLGVYERCLGCSTVPEFIELI